MDRKGMAGKQRERIPNARRQGGTDGGREQGDGPQAGRPRRPKVATRAPRDRGTPRAQAAGHGRWARRRCRWTRAWRRSRARSAASWPDGPEDLHHPADPPQPTAPQPTAPHAANHRGYGSAFRLAQPTTTRLPLPVCANVNYGASRRPRSLLPAACATASSPAISPRYYRLPALLPVHPPAQLPVLPAHYTTSYTEPPHPAAPSHLPSSTISRCRPAPAAYLRRDCLRLPGYAAAACLALRVSTLAVCPQRSSYSSALPTSRSSNH